jgi:hypothetical protein
MYADPKFRPLSVEAVTLLQEGRQIDAIKAVRDAEGLGLKEAKARVDAHLAREPLLRAQLDAQRSVARRKFFYWFVAVDVVITVAVIYWFFLRGSP